MIVLNCFGPLWGLPDPSPFVIKSAVQLKMSGLAFRTEKSRPPESPKGKLPFIEDDDVRIGDSTFIREHLERKYGVDLDAGLSRAQRAQAWAVERVVEDHLYWAIVYGRWAVRENFDKGPAIFFGGAPPEVRWRRPGPACSNGAAQPGRRPPFAQPRSRIGPRRPVAGGASEMLLSDGPLYPLAGDHGRVGRGAPSTRAWPRRADPALRHPDAGRDVPKHPNLVAYAERMMRRFYPSLARPILSQCVRVWTIATEPLGRARRFRKRWSASASATRRSTPTSVPSVFLRTAFWCDRATAMRRGW